MRTLRHSRALPLAGLVLAAVVLSGCSGGSDTDTAPSSSPTPTPSASPQPDAEYGKALGSLIYSGDSPGKDANSCLVTVFRDAKVSNEAEKVIVTTGGDDLGAMATTLRTKKLSKDADLLLSDTVRDGTSTCVNDAQGTKEAKVKATKVEPKADAAKPGKPNLKPKYKFDKNEEIHSSNDLQKGLVSMFVSFNPDSKELITKSAECMSQAVMNEKFSPEALKFIAGGAPIGSGSLVEHLPSDADKKLWNSSTFQQSLSDCTTERAQQQADENPEGVGP